ncbi:MAG: tail fiber domain-containing protein [Chitinophagaceae bacterium]|nr:tail fiber domain-containing protein [Chitinophagaceae bacterium]
MKKFIHLAFFSLTVIGANAQTGIGTASPTSDLHVAGAVAMNIRSVTTSAILDANDQVILYTGTTAANITLPDAIGCDGRIYWVKNASVTAPTPVTTILTSSSQLVGGNSSWILDEPNEVVRLVSDGANWQVFSQNAIVSKTSTVGSAWLQGGNKLKSAKAFGAVSDYGFTFLANNTAAMQLTNAGWLGLGTLSPAGHIHSVTDNDDNGNDYYFDDYGTAVQGIFVRKSRGSVLIPSDLQNNDLIGQQWFAPRFNNALVNNSGSGVEAYYTGNGTNISSDLRFTTSSIEQLRVHQTGYVGIGTTAFNATNSERLLVDAGNTSSYNVISGKGEIDNYLQLNIRNSNAGTIASSDIVATANNGTESVNYIDMGINSSGYTSTLIPILDGPNEAYFFAVGGDMKIGNAAPGFDLGLFNGGYTLASERIRITSGGNVGIGTSTPQDKLSVAGITAPSVTNTYSIGTSANRWSEVWTANGAIQTSDARLKNNIHPISYGIATLLQLQPVSYRWIKDGSKSKIGLIAQQVRSLIPEVVKGDESTEALGMNYAELVPVLIKTIQEQQQQLSLLKARLEMLKNQ